MYGIAISPSINGNVMAIGVVDATANTLSVMPNAVISCFVSDILPIFCDRKVNMPYRRFITNVVNCHFLPYAGGGNYVHTGKLTGGSKVIIEITIAACLK